MEETMTNRKFLLPLAILAAAFASDEAMANVQEPTSVPQTDVSTTPHTVSPDRITVNQGQDRFSFVLKRMEGGMVMADHESHASHASHGSHSSHYSGS